VPGAAITAAAAAAAAPLLACAGITKRFGAMAAVNALSFEVRAGEVLGIGGPNGAGKTTMFDVVTGLTMPDDGQVSFDGRDVTRMKPQELCHRGLVRTFQLNAGYDTLSARENVLVGAYFGARNVVIPGLRVSRAARARAETAMDLVGLADVRRALVKNLPVYQRKLLMIASALATEPKLLMMDEPVGGLNPHEIDDVMKVVARVRASGVTIVLIEHVMRFLVALSDRVLIMHHGEKIYEGAPEGLVRDRTVIEVYLGAGTAERLKHLIAARGAA
jgi:branched-chain amino acid transport system ATP-binding protein